MLGFWNRLLRIDLATGESRGEAIPDEVLSAGLGGKGLGSYLLLREAPPGVEPFSPANPLIFACGPATATTMPGASRYGVYAKSPLTRGYAESYSGGHVAPQIKQAGYDAIVITGKARAPAYVHISHEGASLRPASRYWGLDTHEAEAALLKDVATPGAQAVVIGPAGENLVRYACIVNNKGRCAGRSGLGAVMGSKNLKGIVFSGRRVCPIVNEAGLKQIADELTRKGNQSPSVASYRKYGTTGMVATANWAGCFPTRYWSAGVLEGWESLSAESLLSSFQVEPRACYRCFFACGKLTTARQGRHAGLTVEGPEYETIYAFGGLCLIRDLAEIAYLNDLCDRLGLDTMTAGNMVALCMEAREQGREGLPAYGDAEGAAELIRETAYRKGKGDFLAEGIRRASLELGLESRAIHVKGMEPAGYDPRVLPGMGLAYAVASRGACHLRSTFYKFELSGASPPDDLEGKAALLVELEDRLAIFDSLILCRFYRDLLPWASLQAVIRATTGLELGQEELRRMGNHIITLTRAFNYREGFTREDDALPARFHDEPIDGSTLSREALARMLAEYYRLRGWDEQGRPPELLPL